MKFLFKTISLFLVAYIAAIVPAYSAPPKVALAADPLFATASVDKPSVVLALSVEFPTVGAQFVKNPGDTYDNSYSWSNEYLGYYDAESCYLYNDDPIEIPSSGQVTDDYRRFYRVSSASNRQCEDAFSGNFLNWVSSSAVDMLRLSLTGGDRYIDRSDMTVLQRAVLPNGSPICMWGSSYFPIKQLLRGDGNYSKAVPKIMRTRAYDGRGGWGWPWRNGDIWVANSMNRIYFGTDTSTGDDCGWVTTGPDNYKLGSSTPDNQTWCASENSDCKVVGNKIVWYGSGSQWTYKYISNRTIKCDNNFFGGDPRPNFVKKCYVQDRSEVLNGGGFFYARSQVCNSNTNKELLDQRDYDLCKKYPNGNFKPTGVVQKYSNQVRMSAFGYLLDQTKSRYGGVLRAPMKYVGDKVFDINGVETGNNSRREWDANTGVFIANPEGDANFPISGVVNYLNQFGRTGTEGMYKQFDPVGELHYEALRYLQGLPPSSSAITGINDAMKDGFPVYTTWTDPYEGRDSNGDYACLKSNIVLIADTGTHDQNRLPTASASQNIPDINYWRSVVQNFELNKVTNYTDSSGKVRTTGNPNGAATSVPTRTDRSQIMGSAYWARTQDIRGKTWTANPSKQMPGLRVKTFVFDVNERGEQNDVNKRRTDQLFLAAKYGGFETDPSNLNKNPFNTWGNPFRQEDGTPNNLVWQDADTRPNRLGEANTYFLQSDARGVLSAFDDIFRLAATASRSIAGSAMQGQSLTKDGGFIYQAAFDSADWSGDLLATAISVDASSNVFLGAKPAWAASERLAALSKPADERKIFVGKGGQTAPVAMPFKWKDISPTLKDDLNKLSSTAAADNLGETRLNYLSGDRSKEGNPFRVRSKLLGDIVNSGVVFSGAPTTQISSSTYATFYNTNKDRTPAVFVGANDGMMHAFHANTGDELFAYIPSWVGSRLSALTSETYATKHQSYVDGTPVVAEAEVGAGSWKTVLVSGTGGGGKGVFALDVTDPAKFTESQVLWEFTSADDSDMGFVVGRPRILKFESSVGVYKWYAVVGGGVNNDSGKAVLFILDLAKKAGDAWVLGTNYYKFVTPFVDATLESSTPNGLINFQSVIGVNKEVNNIFMGDLHGNLWKLNFKDIYAVNWNINAVTAFNKGTATSPSPYPLFIAKDDSGAVQPITIAPTVVYGTKPNTSLIYFGTGKYLEKTDINSTVQSAYLIYDNGIAKADSSPIKSAISGRGRLQKGTVASDSGNVSVEPFTFGRPDKDIDRTKPNPIASGWYFDFPASRERQINSATVLDNKLVFGTLIPALSGTTGSCNASGGTGKQYTISMLEGNGDSAVSKVGILGDTMTVEVVSARKYSPKDSTGKTVKTITTQTLQQGSEGVATSDTKTTNITAGRLSWRQIHNYQDLRNKP